MFPDAIKFFKISLVTGVILGGFAVYYYLPAYEQESGPRKTEYLYQTWELKDVYRNGQKVIDERNDGLQMTIAKDSTALESVRGLSYKTIFYADKELENLYTGQQNSPEKYKIYTLTENTLKYGQHSTAARYLFVFKAKKK
jgi:hypothetical protein